MMSLVSSGKSAPPLYDHGPQEEGGESRGYPRVLRKKPVAAVTAPGPLGFSGHHDAPS